MAQFTYPPISVAVDTSLLATEATLQSVDSKITAADTGNVTITSSVLPSGAATSAKQDSLLNAVLDFSNKSAGSLVPESFDYQIITYVSGGKGDGEIETVTYKLGGPSGTTVAVLTLAYDGSNRLSSVTRS